MDVLRRSLIKTVGGLGAAALAPRLAGAQSPKPAYPSDTVTIVVPFAPGGSTDLIARLIAADLNTRHGGRFIVDNRSGAAATIGTRQVAIAPADGRMLLYTTATPFVINPSIYQTLPYDPRNGFAPIALTVQLPLVVAVSKDLGVKTLPELVERLRRNDKGSSFSSYGNGTASHISGALFVRKIGAPGVLHVPYKDTRALPDLAAGRNTFQIDAWSTVAPLVNSGKLVVLAVCGPERMPALPGVPTVASLIRQEFDVSTWHGLFAPRGTPVPVLDMLHDEVGQAMGKDHVRKAALEQGFVLYPPMSRKDMETFIANDRSRWKRFIETAGIEPV